MIAGLIPARSPGDPDKRPEGLSLVIPSPLKTGSTAKSATSFYAL
jgi:hypothetical protein